MDRPAYFEVKCSPDESIFVIKLVEQSKIDHARRIIAGTELGAVHVSGTVINALAPFNPEWPFHLRPESVSFFEVSMEVCDASIKYVADHLDEVGGAFLPGAHWCPWASRVIREIDSEILGTKLPQPLRSGEYLPYGDVSIRSPILVGAIADAIATVYLAYKVGSRIDDVADGIVRVLKAIASVGEAIAAVINKIEDVIEEIRRAIEVISQRFNESLMRSHFSQIEAAVIRMDTIVKRLASGSSSESYSPDVAYLLADLKQEERALFLGILSFVRQESPSPTQATIISIAPAIGAWAHAYTLLERYRVPSAQRMAVWDSAEHNFLRTTIISYCDSVDRNRQRMENELRMEYRTPSLNECCRYDLKTDIFIDGPLFSYIPQELGLYAIVSGSMDGLHASVFAPSPSPYPGEGRLVWKPVSGLTGTQHERVLNQWRAKCAVAAKYREYLALTKNSAEIRVEFARALARPTDW